MVILLEGADGSGKSTLYEKLKELLPRKGYNFINHLDRDAIGHHLWWKKKINSPYVYIIDRGFISELIYRPIKRDKIPNISLEEIGDICNEYLCVVYCKTERQLADMLYRGDDYISSNEYPAVTRSYDSLMGILTWFTRTRVVEYDWTKDNVDDLVKYIRGLAKNNMSKWTVDYVKKIQQLAYETDVVSLNSTVKTEEHDDCELGDFVIDERNFFEELDETFNRESILSLIHELNEPRMERILILRYGLDGSNTYRTLDEIGEMYGVTRERIRQIEDKALLRLRRLIQNKQLNYDDFIGG